MKKTLIALMALAGVAAAETVTTTYEPLKDSGWNLSAGRLNSAYDSNKAKQDATAGKIYTSDPWWKQPYATLDFANGISLQNKTDSISFSFTLNLDTIQLSNSIVSVAFEGNSGGKAATILMGYGGQYDAAKNTHFKSALLANNSSDVYLFDTSWDTAGNSLTQYKCETTTDNRMGALAEGATLFSGEIAWNDTEGAYILTLTQGGIPATFNLGTSYEMTGISIAMDGNSQTWEKDNLEVSGLTITKTEIIENNPGTSPIPEPTTATLSLLALAGLAARRRRK